MTVGATQVIFTDLEAAIPTTEVGAPGTVRGVIADEDVAVPEPTLFVATTENV